MHLEEALARPTDTAVLERSTTGPSAHGILSLNWPNPFNESTRMRYRVDAAQRVQLAVYDLLGRPVCSLSNRDTLPGTYELTWDGRDEAGRSVAAGVYWIYMTTESHSWARKVVLLN